MKKWYESKLMWLAVTGLLVAAMDTLASGGDWRSAPIAGMSGLVGVLRMVTTKGIETEKTGYWIPGIVMSIVVVTIISCGGSRIPEPTPAQRKAIAIEVACSAAASAGCLVDIETLMGPIKTSNQCVSVLTGMLDAESDSVTRLMEFALGDVQKCTEFTDAIAR